VGSPDRFQPVRIGQPEVEQNNVNLTAREVLLRLAHGLHVCQFGVVRALLVEHLEEQTSISGVILDHEK
jgi:predicted outer membrane lipoprotein